MTDIEKLAELEAKLSALQAAYDDHECVCDHPEVGESAAEAVDAWLTRANGLGTISAEGRATVERLLEDLR